MKNITIFKRKANKALFAVMAAAAVVSGCQKGTFDINTNPNSPTTVAPKLSLSSSLAGTASLMYNGNADMLQNWMGYWTQSGGYTPSNTYVLYQLTSGTGSGNWDQAYINLNNYKTMITASNTAALSNYKAVGMIMTAFVFQRIVDLYDKAPFTTALTQNAQYSYKYDDGATIYKGCIAKIDSALALINANLSGTTASSLGNYDVMFKGDMTKWIKFGNTLKLKMYMRQTATTNNGSLGDAGVKAALATNPLTGKAYVAADFLGAGENGDINPGYSSAADAQVNPEYLDVVANSAGSPGTNQKYFRANAFYVTTAKAHKDLRDTAFYYPNGTNNVILGRVYGSQNGNESNTLISALRGWGFKNGYTEDAPVIPGFESLFLQAEATYRGYLSYSSAADLYTAAVTESYVFVGLTSAQAAAYLAQTDPYVDYATASDKLEVILDNKWAALNSTDVLESYSDYRRTGYPKALPISIYPGADAVVKHIPWRFPYPTSELNYNSANVPSGGTATDVLTKGVFWMAQTN